MWKVVFDRLEDIGVAMVNADCTTERVNPALARWLGRDVLGMAGIPLSEYMTPLNGPDGETACHAVADVISHARSTSASLQVLLLTRGGETPKMVQVLQVTKQQCLIFYYDTAGEDRLVLIEMLQLLGKQMPDINVNVDKSVTSGGDSVVGSSVNTETFVKHIIRGFIVLCLVLAYVAYYLAYRPGASTNPAPPNLETTDETSDDFDGPADGPDAAVAPR